MISIISSTFFCSVLPVETHKCWATKILELISYSRQHPLSLTCMSKAQEDHTTSPGSWCFWMAKYRVCLLLTIANFNPSKGKECDRIGKTEETQLKGLHDHPRPPESYRKKLPMERGTAHSMGLTGSLPAAMPLTYTGVSREASLYSPQFWPILQ